jgi:hypothetical protein
MTSAQAVSAASGHYSFCRCGVAKLILTGAAKCDASLVFPFPAALQCTGLCATTLDGH